MMMPPIFKQIKDAKVDLETPINPYCTEEDNDEYNLTELERHEFLRRLTALRHHRRRGRNRSLHT